MKLLIGLMGIGLIGPVIGGSIGEENVVLPTSNWVAITPLYLKPVIGSHILIYGTSQTVNDGITTIKEHVINPDYNPGFNINLGHTFENSANGIVLQYTRIHTNDSDSFSGPGVLSLSSGNTSSPVPGTISGNLKLKLDQVDVMVSREIHPFDNFELLLKAGLRYAQIDRLFNFSLQQAAPIFNGNATEQENYEGVGPVVGLNGEYLVTKNLGWSGMLDAALLSGSVNNQIAFHGSSGTTLFSTGADSGILPIVEAGLGITYNGNLSSATNIKIGVGYEVANYFDLAQAHHNVSYSGPYATFALRR
ncbi:Lpg1974 family pore-forming outer membrane protein [Legionella brunensis]|uniref:Major outer membrane protein n=1 Tax=Legionella brunensis TaxID=29422 RepID=A0A0W0SPH3_9GAMM|nr:Lpg1974 family pore-forming outer membrane protein [Legionella brunensis]KTC85187.1 major outer membrane protein [Legionella brunensis]